MTTQQLTKQIQEMLNQAEQLAGKHDWSGAADLCRDIIKTAPDNTTLLGQFGWYLSRAKLYDEAVKIYEKLFVMEPKLAKWPYMAGYQYYDQKMFKEAIIWFDKALARHSTYLIVLYRKGYAHSQLSENNLAVDAFDKCIAVWKNLDEQGKEKEKKSYSDACFQLGKVYLSTGQTRKAEPILAEAVRNDFQDAYKYYEYGKSLLKNQKPEEALAQLQKAQKLEPRKDFINAYIAQALLELSRVEEADKILAKIPERIRKEYIWRAIGRVKLAQGKTSEAVDAIKQGIRLDDQNHNSHYNLGLAYIASNDYSHAYQALSQALSLRKNKYNLDFPEAKQKLDELIEYAENNGINLKVTPGILSSNPMGIITNFNEAKGFGFIKRDGGEPNLFFHISNVINPDLIEVGRGVEFKVEDSPKGKRAKDVKVIEQ
jgi:tetratricopeptide (TPR) repeat protein